jgi:hypothetical protein
MVTRSFVWAVVLIGSVACSSMQPGKVPSPPQDACPPALQPNTAASAPPAPAPVGCEPILPCDCQELMSDAIRAESRRCLATKRAETCRLVAKRMRQELPRCRLGACDEWWATAVAVGQIACEASSVEGCDLLHARYAREAARTSTEVPASSTDYPHADLINRVYQSACNTGSAWACEALRQQQAQHHAQTGRPPSIDDKTLAAAAAECKRTGQDYPCTLWYHILTLPEVDTTVETLCSQRKQAAACSYVSFRKTLEPFSRACVSGNSYACMLWRARFSDNVQAQCLRGDQDACDYAAWERLFGTDRDAVRCRCPSR